MSERQKPTTGSVRLADRNERDWRAVGILLTSLLLTIVLSAMAAGAPANESPTLWVTLSLAVSAMVFIAIVIWQACEPFAEAAQWIGIRFRLPPSVRGATLDAVASSMPELFSGIFFVIVAVSTGPDIQQQLTQMTEGFGSSIAICAGSAIYNLMLIPAVCAITISYMRPERPQIEFSKEVINRDGAWVIAVQLGLLIVLFLPRLHWWIALLGIAAYGAYATQMYFDARRHQRHTANTPSEQNKLPDGSYFLFGFLYVRFTMTSVIATLAVATAIAAGACYGLVELTNYSAHALNIPPFFVAVILAAAASSIPDTFVSLGAARRGDDSGAISNVFGSNIFDICIGMALPLLVCCYLNGWQPLELMSENHETIQGVAGLRILLFVLTSIGMSVLWTQRRISRRTAYLFCGLYALFVGYAVLGSLGVL